MNTAVLRITVLATVVTMATSATITPTVQTVTVRLGEAIHLSCNITLSDIDAAVGLSEVRWYRGSSLVPYGSIDVERNGCPAAGLPCPEGITTDNRGTVRYEIGASNDPVLTLTISGSTLNDSTSFSCGIIKVGGSSQTSSRITVTVYVHEASTPNGQQTPLGTTPTASTSNSPHTTSVNGSISSHQTSNTPIADTTSPTRQTTVGSSISSLQSSTTSNGDASSTTRHTTGEVTATPIAPMPSEQSLMEPTTIKPDTGFSSIVTIVTPMTTMLASVPGAIGSPASTTTIIAVAASACVIVILFVIIARLVSRKSRPSEPTLLNLTEPTPGSRNANVYRQDQESPHIYEGTLARTTQPQDVESSTSELPPPIYAIPSTRRKDQTACNVYTQQNTVPTRRPGHRDQHDDPEINAVEPSQDKVGYPASQPSHGEPPEYARIDPHSRPTSTVESGHSALRVAAMRPDQAEEGDCAARPRAETPQPPEYAQLEPDSEPQTAGIPEPSSGSAEYGTATSVNPDDVIAKHVPPEYATLEPDSEPQAAGIPEHSSPEYATLEPGTGVPVVAEESGLEYQEAGDPEDTSPEYATLNPDIETSDYGDEVELLTDDLYAEPFPTM